MSEVEKREKTKIRIVGMVYQITEGKQLGYWTYQVMIGEGSDAKTVHASLAFSEREACLNTMEEHLHRTAKIIGSSYVPEMVIDEGALSETLH